MGGDSFLILKMLELMPPFYFLTFAKVSVSVSKNLFSKNVSVSKKNWSCKSHILGLEKFGLKSLGIGLKKSLGIGLENIWSRKKVSVSVSKKFGLEKKSWYWSRKYLV